MREGVTSGGGSELPVPAGQGGEVVEQTASSGRGEAAPQLRILSFYLHCPMDGVGVLNWPRKIGRLRVGTDERRGMSA